MGCRSSRQLGVIGENRPEELTKCAEVSGDVRWPWLRNRSLFNFAELRWLFDAFTAACKEDPQSQQHEKQLGTSPDPSPSLAPMSSVGMTTDNAKKSKRSSTTKKREAQPMMDKAQFLLLCEDSANDTLMFRLGEVVGAFGSRLFDVLDEDGDGLLTFETFVLGLSKLLKGPESEKLKLMYAAYDLSGVAPSEERKEWRHSTGRNGNGAVSGGARGAGSSTNSGGGVGKSKSSRRSKYLTLEDITAVLASASQVAVYPTLLKFNTEGGVVNNTCYLSGTRGCWDGCYCCSNGGGESKSTEGSSRDGEAKIFSSRDSGAIRSCSSAAGDGVGREGARDGGGHGGRGREKQCGGSSVAGGGWSSARTSDDPEALAELLSEIARRNAAAYAAQTVSEFGQAQNGALTQKEFERWALTGPVLRCRINEFSIDLNLAPFQGIQLT